MQIDGTKEQIESAKQLVYEVISEVHGMLISQLHLDVVCCLQIDLIHFSVLNGVYSHFEAVSFASFKSVDLTSVTIF